MSYRIDFKKAAFVAMIVVFSLSLNACAQGLGYGEKKFGIGSAVKDQRDQDVREQSSVGATAEGSALTKSVDWAVIQNNLLLHQGYAKGKDDTGSVTGGISSQLLGFAKILQVDKSSLEAIDENLLGIFFLWCRGKDVDWANQTARKHGFYDLNLQISSPDDSVAVNGVNFKPGDLPAENMRTEKIPGVKCMKFASEKDDEFLAEVAHASIEGANLCRFTFKGFTFYLLEKVEPGFAGFKQVMSEIRRARPINRQYRGFVVPVFSLKRSSTLDWMRKVKVEGYSLTFKEEIEIKFRKENFKWKSGGASATMRGMHMDYSRYPQKNFPDFWHVTKDFGVCMGVGEGHSFIPLSYYHATRNLWERLGE